MRHKHADVIIAWANGAEIQSYGPTDGLWFPCSNPKWEEHVKYRVNPKTKKWYENIPEHGILAKNIVGNCTGVLIRKPSNVEQWIPLTNEEIERFKR